MADTVLAEGTNLNDLEQYPLPGNLVKLYYDHDLTSEEVAYLQSQLGPYLMQPIQAQGNMAIVVLAVQPEQLVASKGVAQFWFWLPIMAVGGFLGWQIVQPGGTLETLLQGPLVIIAAGAAVAAVIWAIGKSKGTMKPGW